MNKVKAATKSAMFQELSTRTELSRKQVATVFDELANYIEQEIGRKGPGVFTLPGLLKLTRKDTPAKPARQGTNPQTKQPMMFPESERRRNRRPRDTAVESVVSNASRCRPSRARKAHFTRPVDAVPRAAVRLQCSHSGFLRER